MMWKFSKLGFSLLVLATFPLSMPAQEKSDTARSEATLQTRIDSLYNDSLIIIRLKSIEKEIPLTYHPYVKKWIKFFTERERFRRWFEKALVRMWQYEPLIDQKLAEAGMPLELKYLALIESAYKYQATSRAYAVGIWQFIYSTGRIMGLKIDAYTDERRDPVKSTEAAIKYLSKLYEEFGDWHLAMAGYNAGERRVHWAIRKANPKDTTFWEIMSYLPAETRNYVPKYISAVYLGHYYHLYGLRPDTVKPDVFVFSPEHYDEIEVRGGVSLLQIAHHLEIHHDTIIKLNPAWRMGRLPANKTYTLRLPCEYVPKFHALKDSIYGPVPEEVKKLEARLFPRKIYHRVRRGETLSHIARRYGTSVRKLKAWNGIRGHLIYPGQKLVIYVSPRYN
ncbi:MAG: transglycosylase SLT domain-containing protein [Chlorobi bacterium]|nr:transglycosylase SLT domain-containing protein [Chlorobiota bacterium]